MDASQSPRPLRLPATALWILVVLIVPRVVERVATQWYLGQWYLDTGNDGMPPAEVVYAAVRFGKPLGIWIVIASLAALWPGWGPVKLYRLWPNRLAAGVAVGLLAGAAWAAVISLSGAVAPALALDPAGKLAALPLTLTTGVGEELLYRGFILGLLVHSGVRPVRQVLVSAALFALSAAWFNWDAVFWGLGFGLTLSGLAVWRGNVWPAVAAHLVFEVLLQPALILGKLEAALG
ncbi:MAG: CPBP family intramembrane metalloprotease [Candidatus Hydrogenedentes bacterium]|nr:CPBP family intramembrane metalloprotease [Candidatus Hydrogenedentota bacterium]